MGFLRKRLGVAVIVSSIGTRSSVKWGDVDRVQVPGQPFLTSKTHNCARAALMDAVLTSCGTESALYVNRVVDRHAGDLRGFKPLS